INDTYGHSGGDIALKELARILTETFRSGDFVARIGGDEFAVILPGCPAEAGNTIIDKVSRINEELSGLQDIKNVSVSVGVAFSEVGYNEKLFKNADEALYQVKENGRHGCRIFSN
ncbi:MAG: GGDEF domain-containing protein, partial [Treponema sp.]|nr:GGDEF domain-containing protein [Treponema sp.]